MSSPIRQLLFGVVGASLAAAADPPTFVDDVAPILAANCIECHYDGGIGPFPLVSYQEARRRARQIVEVTESGYMPPWKPDRVHTPALQGERSLVPEAIAKLRRWLDAGSPSGDLSRLPPPDLPDGEWTIGEPDLVLTFDEPFVVPPEGVDIFRNFVLPIPVEQRRYVRAIEFLPESALVVHHAIIAFDPTDRSRRLDAAEPGPGFESMDTGGGIHPNGHIVGWTPGQHPYEVHPGTAFAVDPGTDLILQLHLLPSGREERLAPRIGIHFTDTPPTRAGFSLLLREDNIYLPAGSTGIVVAESITLPAPAAVLGMYPHAHYLGKDIRLTATLPDGSQQWLLHIPDWDFSWQSDYRYREPLPLPAGTRIDLRYTYDNSADNPRNPHHPPVDVRAGNSSFDEMGSAVIQFLLEDFADIPKFVETQSRYQIASGDGSADAQFNLAVAVERQGRTEEAIAIYQNALAIDPHYVWALHNLGSLRERGGDTQAARRLYEQALASDPTLVETRLNLAELLLRSGALRTATETLTAGLELNPDNQTMRLLLANALLAQGRLARAHDELVASLDLKRHDPANPPATARLLLTRVHMMSGDDAAAVSQLNDLLALPEHERPSEDDLLSQLPYPGALPLVARALVQVGQKDAAADLLRRHAEIADQRGRRAEGAALRELVDQL